MPEGPAAGPMPRQALPSRSCHLWRLEGDPEPPPCGGSTPVTLLPPLDEIAARGVAATATRQVDRTGVSTGFTTKPVWLIPGRP